MSVCVGAAGAVGVAGTAVRVGSSVAGTAVSVTLAISAAPRVGVGESNGAKPPSAYTPPKPSSKIRSRTGSR